jgi:hypothetical protein
VYPSETSRIPRWVMDELAKRLRSVRAAVPPGEPVCGGTLLSRAQYLYDVTERGFKDARSLAGNPMTRSDIALWTAGIAVDGPPEMVRHAA